VFLTRNPHLAAFWECGLFLHPRVSVISEILLFFKMKGLISLSFLAALPSMSALPTNSNPNPTKRGIAYPDLGVVAFSGDSCGTSSFQISRDGQDTNIDDCKGLSAALRSQDRHWPLTNGYGGKNWINVAKNGNCAF
jgi:hypothetical protein